jgi:lysophospholipase L1-like esterase
MTSWVRAAGGMAAAMILATGCGGPNNPTPTPDAPALACPANITQRGIAGGMQQVSYALPTVTGGAAPVSVTCAPGSGSSFSIGTTAVACSAVDTLSRNAQCAFTITLTPLLLGVTKFLAFGDSLTEGQNGRAGLGGRRIVDVPNAYPTKLDFLLNLEYPGQGIVVSNYGLGGEPIDSGRLRLPGVLAQEKPGALLLLEGYNNLLASCRPQDANSAECAATIEDVVSGLRKMIQIARTPSYGTKYVLVSTLTPPGPYRGIGNDRRISGQAIVQTNGKLLPVIRGEGAIVVDAYQAFLGHEEEYVDQDGLHLRPAGYQALADTFFAAIKSNVTSTPAFGGIH